MKIAIVGSGISGLTAAYYLSEQHEITVFEAADYIGGHTNTVALELDGRQHYVDTGFIVFNEQNYPNFTRLLRALDVATQPTRMSFSVRSDRTGLEYNGTSLNTLFAQRGNLLRPGFYRMIRDILRFHHEAGSLSGVEGDGTTVADFAVENGFSSEFVEYYLIPLGASLWSAPAGTFRRFPIRFVVDFLANHGMLQVSGRPHWRVIRGGSFRYVEKLVQVFRDRILLKLPVAVVERRIDHVRLVDGRGAEGTFDHVIFACHSDQALRILSDPTPAELDVLGAFPYQPNEAVLHTDTSVLPRRRRAWASWNYHIPQQESDRVAVTYNMNILQGLPPEPTFNVTLNDDKNINPAKVIRRISYEHPIYTSRRAEAQRCHPDLIGANRTSFCGAYWGYGFHEDGVSSALRVVQALIQESAA